MNEINLNEYISEGLGEIKSLIAHEVYSFFKMQPQRFDFLRLSNQCFSIIDRKKNNKVKINYKYLIDQDVWQVDMNNVIHHINDGRSKSVSEIATEMIDHLLLL